MTVSQLSPLALLLSKGENLASAYRLQEWLEDENLYNEAKQVLTDLGPLNVIEAIQGALSEVEVHVLNQFWSRVAEDLTRRLVGIKGWVVYWNPIDLSDRCEGDLAIVPTGSEGKDVYQVYLERCLMSNKDSTYFGIWRGDNCPTDQQVTAHLIQNDYKEDKGWIAVKRTSKMGLPTFQRNRESILAVKANNDNPDNPDGQAIMNELLNIFTTHRARLEQLNRKHHNIKF